MSQADIGSSFEAKIKPVLEAFELERKRCVKKCFMWMGFVVVFFAGVATFLIGKLNFEAPVTLIFLSVFFIFAMYLAYSLNTNGYKAVFKDEVVGSVVQNFDEGLKYQSTHCITRGQFQESELFKSRIDRYKGEDRVSGIRDKTEFEFSEVHAEYKTTTSDSKGRRKTHWHTIFKGIFFIADFHKNFATRTVVLPDTAEKYFGFLGKKLQSMNVMRGELIKLEDPGFEKEFCVYGEDQIEARYILSPSLMQRILGYKKKFGSKVSLAFANSKVYVALSTNKNYFEPRVFSPVNDMSLINQYTDDLEMIIGISEDLNLNTRLWTKE